MACKAKTVSCLEMAYKGACYYCATLVYQPICGSDGKDYNSDCGIEYGKLINPKLSIVCRDECKICCPGLDIYDLVCAINNRTYYNRHLLNCVKPKTKIAYEGECKQKPPKCDNKYDLDCDNNEEEEDDDSLIKCLINLIKQILYYLLS